MRLAVIDRELCNPDKCNKECYRFCPGVRMGEKTVTFEEGIPIISEVLCTGCGICVKKCPFKAIKIVNLPEALEHDLIHQYGPNGFRLFRLPIVKFGRVLGIVGRNGTGKTTAVNILSGKLNPNFGKEKEATVEEVLEYFRGTILHDYFKMLYDKRIRVSLKPQPVYLLPRVVKGKVKSLLSKVDERGKLDEVVERLDLKEALNRDVKELSGGELQRLAIAATSLKDAHVYIFDEPSSYNDVYQRLRLAKFIRGFLSERKAVIVVDHDLAFLDYLSDEVSVVYGDPGAYGIFSRPESVRTGINVFLDGYIPADNVRFRDRSITFEKRTPPKATIDEGYIITEYTKLVKELNGFTLTVEPGKINRGEVIGILGPNAIGKTTFVRMLVGELEPDSGEFLVQAGELSYKPQYLSHDFEGTVRDFLFKAGGNDAFSEFNMSSLIHPLGLDKLMERNVKDLSGGELQKLYVTACLIKDADVYLLDEPSAFIDVEDRLTLATAINRYIKMRGKTGVVVDHDLILVDCVSDRIMVFDGEPGVNGVAHTPTDKRSGFNMFLKDVGITIRREPKTGRPRINKEGSRLDRLQKEKGEYFYE